MKLNLLITLYLVLFNSMSVMASGSADDFFRSTGKIYTVLAVVLILFFVIIYFLVRLESKLNKLEKQINDE